MIIAVAIAIAIAIAITAVNVAVIGRYVGVGSRAGVCTTGHSGEKSGKKKGTHTHTHQIHAPSVWGCPSSTLVGASDGAGLAWKGWYT